MTQPQQRPRVEVIPAKPRPSSIDGASPAEDPAIAAEKRAALPVLAAAAALAVVLLGAAAVVGGLRGGGAAAALVEVAVPTAQHEAELARLVAEGLPAAGVTVRDYADIDGDGVYANGVRVVAAAAPTPIGLSPGVLTLTAFAGSSGCITLEVAAPGRVPYQLCLPAQSVTPAIPVR